MNRKKQLISGINIHMYAYSQFVNNFVSCYYKRDSFYLCVSAIVNKTV